MRLKYHRFEDLVTENKRELMGDDKLMEQVEARLEKKQTEEEYASQHKRIFH